jgi:hypothetical protein
METSSTIAIDVGLIEAGIDYMTVTASGSDERLGLGVCARRQARKIADNGNIIQPWSFSGYQGFRTKGLQWGERFDSTIIRVSSDVARWDWWEFFQLSENVTRTDWQVTYRSEVDPQRRVMDHHKQARRHWRGRRDGPTITMVQDDRGGATLYLGKRQSRMYLRCYNKAAESGLDHYERCVRYEVEMKDRMAKSMMASLSSGIDVQPAIVSTVHQMFQVRGISPPWKPTGEPLTQDNGPTSAPDVAIKRRWLREQVRPSVEFLVQHVGFAAIAEDLGLQTFADAGLDNYRPWPNWSTISKGE